MLGNYTYITKHAFFQFLRGWGTTLGTYTYMGNHNGNLHVHGEPHWELTRTWGTTLETYTYMGNHIGNLHVHGEPLWELTRTWGTTLGTYTYMDPHARTERKRTHKPESQKQSPKVRNKA